MNWEIITFIAYFVILLGVALVFYFNGTNKNSEDFFLGGRSMGPWVTALSAQASDMSAWLLMGLPGSILAFGFGQMWIGIGLALGTAANWILCAKRLRTFSKAADDAITLPQYLTNRFATDSRSLQLTCALIFLFAYTIYVASALVAGTSVFTTLFPTVSPKNCYVRILADHCCLHILWWLCGSLLDRLFPGITDDACTDACTSRSLHRSQ